MKAGRMLSKQSTDMLTQVSLGLTSLTWPIRARQPRPITRPRGCDSQQHISWHHLRDTALAPFLPLPVRQSAQQQPGARRCIAERTEPWCCLAGLQCDEAGGAPVEVAGARQQHHLCSVAFNLLAAISNLSEKGVCTRIALKCTPSDSRRVM